MILILTLSEKKL